MTKNITYSVVMPAFNGVGFIKEALRSVLEQSHQEFEFIVVDGGSTDGALDVIKEAAESDPRVVLVHQGEQPGVAAAMNDGIREATGDWVVVMHADDIMEKNRLEVLDHHIREFDDRIGLVVAGVTLIADDDRVIGESIPDLPANPFFLEPDHRDHPVGGLYHPTVKREVLDQVNGYTVECTCTEDVDLYNRVAEAGFGVQIIKEKLMRYRIHSRSASTSKARLLLQQWRHQKQVILERRAGKPETSWESFRKSQAERGLLSRAGEYRKDTGKIHYRHAASALSSRNWAKFVFHGAAGFLFSPVFFLRKIRSRKVRI